MTTNSPNPVDGDVQALIERCQKHLQWLKDNAAFYPDNAESLEEDRLIHEAALAALTAEPIGFIHNCVNPGDTETTSAIFKEENRHYGRAVYLNPPAQLLRPVELPMVKTARSNWSTWNWIEHLGGRFQNGNPGDYIEFGSVYAVAQILKQYRRTVTAEVIAEIKESLRQQGYEVKND